jgi:hypothetical protein
MNNRRNLLKMAGALAVMPIISLSGNATAAQNAAMRSALKYVDKPVDGKKCIDCAHFVPGADAKALGGCKMFPGDTEVSPNGYCNVWAKKA